MKHNDYRYILITEHYAKKTFLCNVSCNSEAYSLVCSTHFSTGKCYDDYAAISSWLAVHENTSEFLEIPSLYIRCKIILKYG